MPNQRNASLEGRRSRPKESLRRSEKEDWRVGGKEASEPPEFWRVGLSESDDKESSSNSLLSSSEENPLEGARMADCSRRPEANSMAGALWEVMERRLVTAAERAGALNPSKPEG